jgi:hypothetical protein
MRRLIVIPFLFALLFVSSAFAQDAETSVAVAPAQHAFEMVGKIDQKLFGSTVFGYVNYVSGLPIEDLFGENASPFLRGEADARITFYGTATTSSRSIFENIFQSVVPTELTFYYNETPVGASFDDPESFKSGTPIASFNIRMLIILNVQEPDVGVLMGMGEGTQTSAGAFTIKDSAYLLGGTDRMYNFNLFGQGFRESTEPLAAQYLFGSYTTVIDSGTGS